MLDTRTLCSTINIMLERMDEECGLAQKALGIRPDLDLAKRRVKALDETIHQLAELIDNARERSILMPPDVINKVRARHMQVQNMVGEIFECEVMVSRLTMRSQNRADLN